MEAMAQIIVQSLVPALLSAGVGGVAAYVGIRSDLAALKVRAEVAFESASRAHQRIDDLHG